MATMSNDEGQRCAEHGVFLCEECKGRPDRIEFYLGEGRQEFAKRKNRASSLRAAAKTRTNPLDKHPTAALYHVGESLKDQTWNAVQRGSTVAIYGPILALAVLVYFVLKFL